MPATNDHAAFFASVPALLHCDAWQDRIRRRGLLRPETLQGFVNAPLGGRRNFARKPYAVVAFELWVDWFFGPNKQLA